MPEVTLSVDEQSILLVALVLRYERGLDEPPVEEAAKVITAAIEDYIEKTEV